MKTRKTTSINRLVKIENGILLPISSGKQGIRFQDAQAQIATWPKCRKLEFVYTSVRLPMLGVRQAVLASLI